MTLNIMSKYSYNEFMTYLKVYSTTGAGTDNCAVQSKLLRKDSVLGYEMNACSFHKVMSQAKELADVVSLSLKKKTQQKVLCMTIGAL